jgi:hypothetical protein
MLLFLSGFLLSSGIMFRNQYKTEHIGALYDKTMPFNSVPYYLLRQPLKIMPGY